MTFTILAALTAIWIILAFSTEIMQYSTEMFIVLFLLLFLGWGVIGIISPDDYKTYPITLQAAKPNDNEVLFSTPTSLIIRYTDAKTVNNIENGQQVEFVQTQTFNVYRAIIKTTYTLKEK